MYLIAIPFRLVWTFTIGLPFFLLGTILFILLDIFSPKSDVSYKTLSSIYKFATLGLFKGLRLEKDEYDVSVSKVRK